MPSPSLPTRVRRPEAGFTLIELLVVMLILAILLPLGLIALRGARATGNTLGSITIAQHYADAVDRFAREHSGRYPKGFGTTDWASGTNASRGPMADVLGVRRYYLRSTPESVGSGAVLLGGSSTKKPTINYASTDTSYEFTVAIPGRAPCVIRGGAGALSNLRACSPR